MPLVGCSAFGSLPVSWSCGLSLPAVTGSLVGSVDYSFRHQFHSILVPASSVLSFLRGTCLTVLSSLPFWRFTVVVLRRTSSRQHSIVVSVKTRSSILLELLHTSSHSPPSTRTTVAIPVPVAYGNINRTRLQSLRSKHPRRGIRKRAPECFSFPSGRLPIFTINVRQNSNDNTSELTVAGRRLSALGFKRGTSIGRRRGVSSGCCWRLVAKP